VLVPAFGLPGGPFVEGQSALHAPGFTRTSWPCREVMVSNCA
jgi:hypothetical protein